MRYSVVYPSDEDSRAGIFVDSHGDFFSFKEAKENLLSLIDDDIESLTEYRRRIASMRAHELHQAISDCSS
jgi:hypothetical protein